MRRAVARAPLAAPARHHSTLQQRVRSGDSEMYLCGSLLPSRARASFFATRALNIEVAGVRDAVRGNAPRGRVRMAFWRDLIGAACEAAPLGGAGGGGGGGGAQLAAHPLFAPLRDAVAAHGHTRRWLERLVDAREADLEGRAPATVAAMEAYFEATQGSLLYLTLEALGVREAGADRAASHLGRAVGIATLLRSLAVHARLGQQYLPLDLLSKVSVAARAAGRLCSALATTHSLFLSLTHTFTPRNHPTARPERCRLAGAPRAGGHCRRQALFPRGCGAPAAAAAATAAQRCRRSSVHAAHGRVPSRCAAEGSWRAAAAAAAAAHPAAAALQQRRGSRRGPGGAAQRQRGRPVSGAPAPRARGAGRRGL